MRMMPVATNCTPDAERGTSTAWNIRTLIGHDVKAGANPSGHEHHSVHLKFLPVLK